MRKFIPKGLGDEAEAAEFTGRAEAIWAKAGKE